MNETSFENFQGKHLIYCQCKKCKGNKMSEDFENKLQSYYRDEERKCRMKTAGDYLESIGIDSTTVVCYHYTNDPPDGIDIDIEDLLNNFRIDSYKELAEKIKEMIATESDIHFKSDVAQSYVNGKIEALTEILNMIEKK